MYISVLSCFVSCYLLCIAILPCFRTLYYALTASSGTTLFALDVQTEGDKMPLRIFPNLPTDRRRRQTCANPLTISLGQGFTTDGDGRAWVSSADTGDIWSCAISGAALCDCMMEVAAASTSVQALAVDEARVYWTNTTGIFYTELNSDGTVIDILSPTVATQILATSPGLQQLPGVCCVSGCIVHLVNHAYEHSGKSVCVRGKIEGVECCNCCPVQLQFTYGMPKITDIVCSQKAMSTAHSSTLQVMYLTHIQKTNHGLGASFIFLMPTFPLQMTPVCIHPSISNPLSRLETSQTLLSTLCGPLPCCLATAPR